VNPVNKEKFICDKLRKLGYARERRIRLYGEEFRLVSNPAPEGDGFAVDGIARGSGDQRRIRVPLSLVVTIRHELAVLENKNTSENNIAA